MGHLHRLHVDRVVPHDGVPSQIVFLLLALTFFLLGIGDAARQRRRIITLGGWLGLATALAAWYASFAAVTNSTFGRTVLPVMPLKR